jgi:hypothetical protein
MERIDAQAIPPSAASRVPSPKTSATPRNGIVPPSKLTPGTSRVATHSAAALTSNRMRNGMKVLFLFRQKLTYVSTN